MWKKFKKNLDFPESYISMGLGLLVVIVIGMLFYNYLHINRGNSAQINTLTQENIEIPKASPLPIATIPAIHRVAAGESLWSIAQTYYHSGYNWVSIATENKISDPNKIDIGQRLIIPKAEVITPQISYTVPNVANERIQTGRYSVVRGDNLWQIALRAYSDGFAWVKIAQINKLENPNLIHPGNVLILPR